jgi:hypothetical protein
MPNYKVSYVIVGNDHPGTIVNQNNLPQVNEQVFFGDESYEIVEVLELMPPRGEFHYIHVTCKPIPKKRK